MESLGKHIQLLRKAHNMSQEELATKLNVTRQAISNWENSKTQPSVETLQEIAKVFNTDLQQVIEGGSRSQNVSKQKSHHYLFALCVVTFLAHLILSFMDKNRIAGVLFAPGLGLSLCTIMYFVFGNSIKNNDFSIIAGYDKNAGYNMETFKEILVNIRLLMMVMTLILNIAYSVIYSVAGTLQIKVSVIFLFVYFANLIGVVLMVNLKYRKSLKEH